MLDIEQDYLLQIDQLRKAIKPIKTFNFAIALALKIHAITHTSQVSASTTPTFCDQVLEGLQDKNFATMPTEKDKTIAYHLWHIARIEDLVGNILIMKQPRVDVMFDTATYYSCTTLKVVQLAFALQKLLHLPFTALRRCRGA